MKDPALAMVFVLLIASACGAAPAASEVAPAPDEPAAADLEAVAREVAVEFWQALAARDYEQALELSSYPFDADAHAGCVETAAEMTQYYADRPLPADKTLMVGEARRVTADMDLSQLHKHWQERIPRWAGPDAPCLGPDQAQGRAVVFYSFLVDFTIDDNPVGSLTRIRCIADACSVAGTEN
jgi:hypothetical protein